MNDRDRMTEELMEMDVPTTPLRPADWDDVLTRAAWLGPDAAARRAPRPRRRRPGLLLLGVASLVTAAAFTASPLGAPFRERLGGWVSGAPGPPAPAGEQQRLERENATRLLAFPAGTRLRELAQVGIGATRVRLLGFRAGDRLCLRLGLGPAADAPPPTQCTARSTLVAGPPVTVVAADYAVDARTHVSYGFAADTVRAVEVVDDTGAAVTTPVRRNVFLAATGGDGRLRRITAITNAGDRLAVPFAPALGTSGGRPPGEPGGPAAVDRTVGPGAIAWLDRRESRGSAVPSAKQRDYWGLGVPVFMRLIAPVPTASTPGVVVALVRPDGRNPFLDDRRLQLCTAPVAADGRVGGGGCSPLAAAFDHVPLLGGAAQTEGSDQTELVSGVASDDVAAVELYGADGSQLALSLADNVFAATVPRALFPVRLVGRDADGRVISTTLDPGAG
jgi:hypothetical protein